MPAVQPPATVLVTGVSGFTAIWVARAFLEAGYAVRGTVRSEKKGQFVADVFKAHAAAFSYVVVDDMSKPGAFAKTLDDTVAAVIHVAGAVHSGDQDNSAMLAANVDGVVGLLQSIVDHGKNVKRFVYMSSAQAMLGHENRFHVYVEDDWNDKAVAALKEKGPDGIDGTTMYQASKVLAERAILDFVEKHKGEISWDATRFVPGWIYGPILHDVPTLSSLNLSSKIMYGYITTPRDADKLNGYTSEYIDVRDVADAFVAATRVEAAGGERFVLDAGAFTLQNLYDAIHTHTPTLDGVQRGNPDAPKFTLPGPFCSPAKAQAVLGLKPFRSLGECAVDTYESIQARGL